MRKSIVIASCFVAIVLVSCKVREQKVAVPTPRETISIKFAAADIEIRESASDTAKVVTKYRITEPASVVSEKDGWTELKIGFDKYGWVHSAELVGDRHEVGSCEGKIRMRVPAEPVQGKGRRGSAIWIKASVNAHGDVTDVRTYQNSTGDAELLERHTAALKKIKFYPMMDEGGSTKPFFYDYKVQF